MDKWFKYILPDKDPYHNRGRDQMRKKGGPDFKCLCYFPVETHVMTFLSERDLYLRNTTDKQFIGDTILSLIDYNMF